MQFAEAHALVQRREDAQAVQSAFINALESPRAFLAFLGCSDDSKLSTAQQNAGPFIADLLQLAETRPAPFRGLFEALFRQYLQKLQNVAEGPENARPAELWAQLFLCSFLAQLSGLKDAV